MKVGIIYNVAAFTEVHALQIPVTDLVDSGGWVPLLDTTDEGPVTCNASTQTEGIFYPSSRTINKAMAATEAVLTSWTMKKPHSGTYSPGRGKMYDRAKSLLCKHPG